jgi:23S rRNA (cytosine1962-C5)-methyltransferase
VNPSIIVSNRAIVKSACRKRLENFHPWVFRGDLLRVEGDPARGEVVDVLDELGGFIGRGYVNADGAFPVRILTLDRKAIDLAFYRSRIHRAISRRGTLPGTDAVRLINAESDGLPGLIVDRFGSFLSVQLRNAGTERHRDLILEALRLETGAENAFERSDTSERSKEGLEPRVGTLWGEVPERVTFTEDDLQLAFSVIQGQKTGFYLDQRENRRRLASMVDGSSRVLDVYSYTGGFSLHAAKRGATAFAVDKDAVALATLETTARANGLESRISTRLGDALEVLDQLVREKRSFTHAVVDPPTLAKRKDEVTAAKRVFTIATKNVLRMLEPNGIVFVSSCAFHIKLDDLIEATRFAAGDAGRRLEILDVTFQPADHPWILQIPESLYLKTLILRAD